ncbi:MAG: Fic family protein [Candidatus Micrarchaeota archaeon]
MAFIRAKLVSGEYYFYLVKNVREGGAVRQEIMKYLGRRDEAEKYAKEKGLTMPEPEERQEEGEKELDRKIAEKKKLLDSLRPFPKEIEERLMEDLVVLWTYNSTAIEGSTLSLKETATLLDEGMVVGNKPLTDYLAAKGHRDAINIIFRWMKEGKKEIREADILELHKATMKGVVEKYLGAYRPVQVYPRGSPFMPPPPNRVPKLMGEFVYKTNRNPNGYDPIALAAVSHLEFESIHPFVDGNGGVGRLLANWVLMKGGYPPIIIAKKERLRYLRLLEQAQTKNRQYGLVLFFKRKVNEALDFYLKRAKPYKM